MVKEIVRYARVSSEDQDAENRVSIEEQLNDEGQLIERNSWNIVATFIDSQKYVKTKSPKKGKRVEPSGEYDDRPAFLEMLKLVKTGKIDAILCWRDDRLVRHPRVAVALEDALDEGNRNRKGKPEIYIFDASGSIIDRFTLGIKAQVWREENKRRSERIKLGKVGTLKAGLWPGTYNRFGYSYDETNMGRGKKIILGAEDEVKTVKDIFNWYDGGIGTVEIRKRLLAEGRQQRGWKYSPGRSHEWATNIIIQILRCEDYTGKATWVFNDRTLPMSIEIPRIIEPEQWQRVQARIDGGRRLSKRNTKGVYLLQNLLYCGECGAKCTARKPPKYFYNRRKDGTISRNEFKTEQKHRYRCCVATKYPDESHGRPFEWQGEDLDDAVWRDVADNVISHPELVFQQVQNRQAELKAQGESLEGDISKLRKRLNDLQQERLTYTRQLARKKITEMTYDILIAESEGAEREIQSELTRLIELRDDARKIKTSIEYTRRFLANLQSRLPEIDQSLEDLKALPEAKQRAILKERQKMIKALCEKVNVFADGRVVIDGLIDVGSIEQFEEAGLKTSGRER